MNKLALQEALNRFVATQPLNPCCLLVHHDIFVLEQARMSVDQQRQWAMVSCATVLSDALLHVPSLRRPSETLPLLWHAVEQHRPDPVLLEEIDLLFEPSLSLDPLWLLRDMSRVTPLVVLWPGSYCNGVLAYATADPPHQHYRTWTQTGLCAQCIIAL